MDKPFKSIYPKVISISLLFGMLFWLIEGCYEFIYFHKDLSFMLLEGPETLIEALFTRVPLHAIFVRVSFILASLFGGILISLFLYRRQLAQYELQKNESRFRAYFENSPAAIYETDAEGQFILINKKWSQISGLTLEQALGDGWQDALHPDDKAYIFNKWKQNSKSGKPWNLEYRFYNTSTQTETWLAGTATAILDEHGKITGYLGVNIDITERKKAEFEAQKAEYERALNEDRLKSLLMLHEKKTLQEKDLLDYALEEAIRLTESECGYLHFVDDDQNHISQNTWSKETLKICTAEKEPHYLLERAGVWADCVRVKKPVIHNDYPNYPGKKGYPKGHFLIKRHMSVPIFDGKKIVAIIGVGNKFEPYNDADKRQIQLYFSSTWDIVKQKRYEEEKKIIDKKLQQSQKMEAIGTLAGGIAHDFNNILSVILGNVDMARVHVSPGSKFAAYLDKVLIAGNRAKDLVRQILAYSRLAKVERIPLQLQLVVKETVKMLRASIPTTIEIQETVDPSYSLVLADPTQVHQIIMNLCTNANHAMQKSGGILTIELRRTDIGQDFNQTKTSLNSGRYMELIVSDTGTGIGPDIIEKIFDPYFTTKEPGKGTGMGLAIIHGIISEYGGAVTVESEVGQGTTVHVYFPTIEKSETETVDGLEEAPTGKGRILFIDDEELLAEMGKDMLEQLGYDVTVMQSSIDALSTFQNSPDAFDVIITDQTMPGITGGDLSKRILQIRPDIPIILCTGYSNLIDEFSAKSIGIREFALKPLTRVAIAKLLKKVLDADNSY